MRDVSLLNPDHPRMVPAIAELSNLVRARFPNAKIEAYTSYEPILGVTLAVTADANLDEIIDSVIERMVDMQLEEGLPIHISPRTARPSVSTVQATTDESVLLPTGG